MKAHLSLWFIAFALIAVGTGCSSESRPCPYNPLPVQDFNWQLSELGGVPAMATPDNAPAPYFRLDSAGKRVTGNTGVNQFDGGYELSGNTLKFGPTAMTRKAGPEPLMEQESAFSTALTNTASWRYFGNNGIDLLDAGGAKLARFTRGAGADIK